MRIEKWALACALGALLTVSTITGAIADDGEPPSAQAVAGAPAPTAAPSTGSEGSTAPAARPVLRTPDSDGSLAVGTALLVVGSGFGPGVQVHVSIWRGGVDWIRGETLGSFVADGSGAFSGSVTVPEGLEAGEWHLTAGSADGADTGVEGGVLIHVVAGEPAPVRTPRSVETREPTVDVAPGLPSTGH